MPGPVYLEAEDVTLHPIEREDLAFCQRCVNDPRVRRGTGRHRPVTADEEEAWYEEAVLADDETHLLVRADDERVGVASFWDDPSPSRRGVAEVGYFVAPDARGNGYATAAVRTLVDHAFEDRRYHKLYAEVAAFNDASRRVLEKVGFQREGTYREEWYHEGSFVDVHRYGLLADEAPRER